MWYKVGLKVKIDDISQIQNVTALDVANAMAAFFNSADIVCEVVADPELIPILDSKHE